MTRKRPIKSFRRRSATPPASAMPKASGSMRSGIAFSSRSTAAISCIRTGRMSSRTRTWRRRCPSEEVLLLKKGGDYGWPMCYYDPFQQTLVLAPEYGGDGKTVGVCAQKSAPTAIFPGALGTQRHGALRQETISRALSQRGCSSPFMDRGIARRMRKAATTSCFKRCPATRLRATARFLRMDLREPDKSPGKAAHRPSGLGGWTGRRAVCGGRCIGPHLSHRVSAARAGAERCHKPVACPSATDSPGPIAAATAKPPEGTHPDAGADTAALRAPPGATPAMVALGNRVYHGQAGGATCTGCHGASGTGSAARAGPDQQQMAVEQWQLCQGIAATIAEGVAQPKQYRAPMPAMGGAQLSSDQVLAVAAYVWALGHH